MSDMLKSYRFREERESDWRKLDLILTRAENSGVKALTDEDMMALPHLYRQAVSSLSVARSISLDQNVITYLEGLCTRAYFYVYGARTSMGERMAQFIRADWPEADVVVGNPPFLGTKRMFDALGVEYTQKIRDARAVRCRAFREKVGKLLVGMRYLRQIPTSLFIH